MPTIIVKSGVRSLIKPEAFESTADVISEVQFINIFLRTAGGLASLQARPVYRFSALGLKQ